MPIDHFGATVVDLEVVPISKGRVRVTRRGPYTPERTVQCEQEYAAAYEAAGAPMYEGPVKVEAVFHAGHVQLAILPLDDLWVKTPRGDVDNLIKTLGDGLNGVAWKDDKQIKWIDARKARRDEA